MEKIQNHYQNGLKLSNLALCYKQMHSNIEWSNNFFFLLSYYITRSDINIPVLVY